MEEKLTDVTTKKDLEEWGDEIVDSLNVSTRRMTDGPDVKNPFQTLRVDTRKSAPQGREGCGIRSSS